MATRVTVAEKALIERAAHERVRRHPQLLSLADYVRSLLIAGARRELGLPSEDETADETADDLEDGPRQIARPRARRAR